MANGPVPKPQRQRSRDGAATLQLQDDGVVRGPDFPYDVVPEPHPATLAWWDTWRRAPQAQLFIATDWQVLRRAARLQEHVMRATPGRGVSVAAVSELRLIEERFGATHVDRARARMTVAHDETGQQPKVWSSRPPARVASVPVGTENITPIREATQ